VGDTDTGDTIIVNVRLENIARAWYLVTIESGSFNNKAGETMNQVILPDNVEYAFMMGPPPAGENAGFIEFTNLKFRRNSFLKFNASRYNTTAALFTILDMVYRGILSERLNVEDLESYEKIADNIGEISDNFLVQSSGLVNAANKKEWNQAKKIFYKLNINTLKNLVKIGVKKGTVTKTTGEKALGMLKIISTIGELFNAVEKMELMGELAGFTIDAPLEGSCLLYAR